MMAVSDKTLSMHRRADLRHEKRAALVLWYLSASNPGGAVQLLRVNDAVWLDVHMVGALPCRNASAARPSTLILPKEVTSKRLRFSPRGAAVSGFRTSSAYSAIPILTLLSVLGEPCVGIRCSAFLRIGSKWSKFRKPVEAEVVADFGGAEKLAHVFPLVGALVGNAQDRKAMRFLDRFSDDVEVFAGM